MSRRITITGYRLDRAGKLIVAGLTLLLSVHTQAQTPSKEVWACVTEHMVGIIDARARVFRGKWVAPRSPRNEPAHHHRAY